jgi:dUTP pyrophosphatase
MEKLRPLVAVKTLEHFEGLELPAYETPESAGMDLRAAIPADEELVIKPGRRMMVPTGLAMALPSGMEAQIRPRSGLALNHGVTVLNSPGTIDADYRGEVKIILINHGAQPFTISRGMRIAQMVIAPVTQLEWMATLDLSNTARGEGGFGSTGV